MHAAGVEQLGGAALADDARQDRAGAHVAAGEPDAVEQERDLGLRACRCRRSDAIARIAPAPAHTPSIAAMIGCGQARIAFTTSPVIRVKSSRSDRVHLDQRPDDLEHVAAGAEIAAGAGDDEGLDGLVLRGGAEDVGDLGVALEGQRVLLVRPVERQGRDLAVDREAARAAPGSRRAAA